MGRGSEEIFFQRRHTDGQQMHEHPCSTSLIIREMQNHNEISPHNCQKAVIKKATKGFPGGAVVESLPANAGDTGSSPGLGGSHMPRSN